MNDFSSSERRANIAALVEDLRARNVEFSLVGSGMKFRAAKGVLSEGEYNGLVDLRDSFTVVLREEDCLCIDCAAPVKHRENIYCQNCQTRLGKANYERLTLSAAAKRDEERRKRFALAAEERKAGIEMPDLTVMMEEED